MKIWNNVRLHHSHQPESSMSSSSVNEPSYLSTFDVGNISDFISSLDSPYLITRELCDRHELAKTFETPLKAAQKFKGMHE